MDPIAQLAVATLAFLGAHFVSSTPLRAALAGAIGERGYLGLYSLVAFAALGWMIWAYARAPFQPLWPGLRLLPALLMPFSLVFIACAYSTRNPTAIGQAGALKNNEPARGIIRVTRHPLMWGVMLWGVVHVLARGDLASVVFFGGFVVLAGLGTVLIDARKAATLGEDWKRFAAATSNLPFGAIAAGRNRFVFGEIGWKRIGAGLAAYVLLVLAHPYLFGARPY
ncbi:MAG TPA: NnrU family protein [Burkholderiales bacterium]|nr:NnrU family protein [Burkholderiales bacterium]